jgi:hypothetical protein
MGDPMNDQPVTVSNSDVVERLARLRTVLPLIATDLAVARRRVTALQAENERLRSQVGELESRLADRRRAPVTPAARMRRATHAAAQ